MMQKFHSGWGECFNGIKCGREVAEYEVCGGLKSGDLEAILTFESMVSGVWCGQKPGCKEIPGREVGRTR